jgi:ATP-binding protein involved in chromosome partitioning
MDLFGEGGGRRLAEQAQVPFLGGIPLEANVRIGSDGGTPIVISHPDSPAGTALRSIAEQVAARVSVSVLQRGSTIPIEMID